LESQTRTCEVNFPSKFLTELEAFPQVLRTLLAAELAAGNQIVEIGHGFPAPPAGAYVKLARPLSTRPRVSGEGIDFYDRNGSLYSGEFPDAKRFYFLLKPPHPPEPEPNMDAIREALRARQSGMPKEEPTATAQRPRARSTRRSKKVLAAPAKHTP